MTNRAVHVDDALLESLEQLEVQRPVVDRVSDLHAETDPEERQHIRERIHDAVDGLADPVAHGQRLHERQDEIGPGPHAPDAEGLSEVLSTLLDPPVLRRVEQPADAGRAVDQEARDLAAGAAKFPLEQAVDGPRHEADVIEAVRDQDLERFGHDHVVDLRDRLQRVAVQLPVELEHRLVERLPGVELLLRLVHAGGVDILLGRALGLREHELIAALAHVVTEGRQGGVDLGSVLGRLRVGRDHWLGRRGLRLGGLRRSERLGDGEKRGIRSESGRERAAPTERNRRHPDDEEPTHEEPIPSDQIVSPTPRMRSRVTTLYSEIGATQSTEFAGGEPARSFSPSVLCRTPLLAYGGQA